MTNWVACPSPALPDRETLSALEDFPTSVNPWHVKGLCSQPPLKCSQPEGRLAHNTAGQSGSMAGVRRGCSALLRRWGPSSNGNLAEYQTWAIVPGRRGYYSNSLAGFPDQRHRIELDPDAYTRDRKLDYHDKVSAAFILAYLVDQPYTHLLCHNFPFLPFPHAPGHLLSVPYYTLLLISLLCLCQLATLSRRQLNYLLLTFIYPSPVHISALCSCTPILHSFFMHFILY